MARYRIVPERSQVWIEARSTLHPIHSHTNGLEGWLELTVEGGSRLDLAAPPAAHVEFPVDQLRSGNPLETRELRRRIDARRYPRITGDLTAMDATDAEGRYRVSGDVTFMGRTRTYEDEVTLSVSTTGLTVTGEATFDVRDFGMEPPRVLMLRVEPDVKVRVEITAEAE